MYGTEKEVLDLIEQERMTMLMIRMELVMFIRIGRKREMFRPKMMSILIIVILTVNC